MVRFLISATFSRVAGDECEMVRCLLEPRVYLRPISSDFLTSVCRKGENIPHLVGDKVTLSRGYISQEGGTRGVKISNKHNIFIFYVWQVMSVKW